jgi:hypothetical protein
MAKKTDAPPKKHISVNTFPVKIRGELTVEQARRALEQIVNSIPDAKLKNFRGGQVLIVK